ncbi:MAG: PIN domain-containing protein [Terracidiphilus sp.]|jgi:predicted nucleic acid-binding protein
MPPAVKKVLLDTSVLINILLRRTEPIARIHDLVLHGFELATSAINVAELYAGMRKGEEIATRELLSALNLLALSPQIAQRAGEISADRRRIGRTHALDDMMIAATVIEYNHALWTDNRKDFEIPGIQLLPD